MDTSAKYIKMCEKAKEIQEKWAPKPGDLCLWVNNTENSVLCCLVIDKAYVKDNRLFINCKCLNVDGYNQTTIPTSYAIWLPRQDQLQNMVMKYRIAIKGNMAWKEKDILTLCDKFREFERRRYPKHRFRSSYVFESMEQLWLAFVMLKLYNKVWNEEREEWEEYNA